MRNRCLLPDGSFCWIKAGIVRVFRSVNVTGQFSFLSRSSCIIFGWVTVADTMPLLWYSSFINQSSCWVHMCLRILPSCLPAQNWLGHHMEIIERKWNRNDLHSDGKSIFNWQCKPRVYAVHAHIVNGQGARAAPQTNTSIYTTTIWFTIINSRVFSLSRSCRLTVGPVYVQCRSAVAQFRFHWTVQET